MVSLDSYMPRDPAECHFFTKVMGVKVFNKLVGGVV